MAQPLPQNLGLSGPGQRKRLQHYIRQIKHLVAERIPPSELVERLRTTQALEKTIEILRGTAVYSSETANLSPPQSWADHFSDNSSNTDEAWTFPEDFASRHLFSLKVSLPSGTILESQKENINDHIDVIQSGGCIYDVLTDSGKQALLNNVFTKIEKVRFFTRITGNKTITCEFLCEFNRYEGTIISQIYALRLQCAFSPSKMFTPLTFTTHHTNKCSLTHIDLRVSTYLGHLSNDLINSSILRLIHPQDLKQFKTMHSELINLKGGIIRQRRFRWLAYNGSIIHSDSEWYACWNPWIKKFDQIIGQHTITEHPIGDANVLDEPPTDCTIMPLSGSKLIYAEREIEAILNKNSNLSPMIERYRLPRAYQKTYDASEILYGAHLGNYIDNLVETLVMNSTSSNKCSIPYVDANILAANHLNLTSVNNTPLLPLSYNEINCLENVHRLLRSQQKTEKLRENHFPPKNNQSDTSRSPMLSSEEDELCRTPMENGMAMPLTRELLQQHTMKWEHEYHEAWKKRVSMKRSLKSDYMMAASTKFFCDENHKSVAVYTSPVNNSISRHDYTNSTSKDEYYRRLGPNPPPPPGHNFQITTVPLPPSVPADEQHRSAFVSVPPTSNHQHKITVDFLQPINLSTTDCNLSTSTKSMPSQQRQYHSVIQNTSLHYIKTEPLSNADSQKWDVKQNQHTHNTDNWENCAPKQNNCAARLISLAKRAQKQQLENNTLLSPLSSSSPEAID